MALLSAIRLWHFRDGMPIREIERPTDLSRNTIRKQKQTVKQMHADLLSLGLGGGCGRFAAFVRT
jgi:hypothetical protein